MGTDYKVDIEGNLIHLKKFLWYYKTLKHSKSYLGDKVDKVITVPAYFNDANVKQLKMVKLV